MCGGPSSIKKLLGFPFFCMWEGVFVLWLTDISRLIEKDGLCRVPRCQGGISEV